MFEYKIQKAWEEYHEDMGLGRILLFIAFYNTFLFFLSGTVFRSFEVRALYPILLGACFYALRPYIKRLDPRWKFFLTTIPIAQSILLNYYLVGVLDYNVDGLERLDAIFHRFDLSLFGKPAALFLYDLFGKAGAVTEAFYTIMMASYISYFLLPLIGGILYFISLQGEYHKVGRYFYSVILFFSLNFILYLLVPVTGPQYYLIEQFSAHPPLGELGLVLWKSVQNGQTTFIDCFPSGHTGIAFLVTIWLFRIRHAARWILALTTLFIIMATLAMRYHYTLDLLCAFPLAYFCHRVAWVFIPVRV